MKILNISTLTPLEGLKLENDIIIALQNYLEGKYKHDFKVAKSLPYVNKSLARLKGRWGKYLDYQKKGVTEISGYRMLVYGWISPPTSNFWLNCFLLPFNRIWFEKVLDKKLAEWAGDSDILLAQNTIPDAIMAYWLGKKYSKPYICTVRGKFKSFIVALPFFRQVFANAASVTTPSPVIYRNLKNCLNIQFIPHPVDNIFYCDGKKDFSRIKLVSVCRLLKLKHIDWVINELGSLSRQGYRFEYNVVGDGPEAKYLRVLAQKLKLSGSVFFHGYQKRSEISKLLKCSNVFMMPSYPETLGRAFLEAAASNCLCVGHENTGVDGLFRHGESAIFVNRHTIKKQMETLFSSFSADYAMPYILNAREIVDVLTWDNIGAKYNKISSDALKKVACM